MNHTGEFVNLEFRDIWWKQYNHGLDLGWDRSKSKAWAYSTARTLVVHGAPCTDNGKTGCMQLNFFGGPLACVTCKFNPHQVPEVIS